MNKLNAFVLLLLLSFLSFSQDFESKVTFSIYPGSQPMRYNTNIKVTDSLITIKDVDHTFNYPVTEKINNFYKATLMGVPVEITIVYAKGKVKGYKYDATMSLTLYNEKRGNSQLFYYIKETE